MFRWYSNARLQWKVLLTPAFLVVVFAAVGVFANQMMRANQTAVQGLMAGPVRSAEVVADFNTAAWRAQVQLYRLMATAANEDDAAKVKSLAADATKALDDLSSQFKLFEGLTFNNTQADKNLADLKGSVADYLKHAASVIDMAEGDVGTAMMLMMNAAKDFALIKSTTDDLVDSSKELRDFEIARNERASGREIRLLATITLIGIAIGCVVSFLIGRGIAKPVTDITNAIKRMAAGDFGTAVSGPVTVGADTARQLAQRELDGGIAIRQKDEVGQLADAFRAMQGQLQHIAAQTGVLVDATGEGQLGVRADTSGFEGGWQRMIEGLNRLVDAYVAPIQMTADYVDRIAKGDI
ncbi:MAG: HAMP domain-containing protein, partial [Azonexus sp.]